VRVFSLVADEKFTLKRRDPGRCDGDDERGGKRALRKAQLFDCTLFIVVAKNSECLPLRVLKSLLIDL
jgi:hypothetical protein